MRMIKESGRRLTDRQRRTPSLAWTNGLVGAAVQLSRYEQPVPVNRGISRQIVADRHRHVVPAMYPQSRAEIASVVSHGGAPPPWEESGFPFLRPQSNSLPMVACI